MNMTVRIGLPLLLISSLGAPPTTFAQVQPWPAEPAAQATVLTHLDPGFRNNLSGAHWNSVTRTLWVVCNGPERFWAIVEDGAGGWKVADKGGQRAEYDASGDTEGITQADQSEDVVYLIAESDDEILAYDVSTGGAPVLLNRWGIKWNLPLFSGGGPEGIAFVPDSWLQRRGFVDSSGSPRTSRHGMGGLMFVGHQNAGGLYVFDLNRTTGAFDFVGRYATAYDETSGLEFDRSTGELHIWHNTSGNVIEISDLTSVAAGFGPRKMTTTRLIAGPRTGNLEGIASTPNSTGEGWWWFTDDGNRNGAALTWFQQFPISGATQSPLTSSLGAASPGDGAVGPSAAEVPMLQVRLGAGSSNVTLQSISVHAQGTANDATDVRSVTLWRDADSDGALSGLDSRVGVPTVFSSDDGRADFSGLNEQILASTEQDYLVTASLSAPPGVSVQVAFDPQKDLLAIDAAGATVLPSGTPLVGGAQRTAIGGGGGTVASGSTASSGGGGAKGGGCSLGSRASPSGGGALVLFVLLGVVSLRRRPRVA